MAPRAKRSSDRITSKTTLTKAIELIASDQLKDTSKKPTRTYLKVNSEAARILLRIVGKDAGRGWQVLLGCDAMSIYGAQIPLAFLGFCAQQEEPFVFFTVNRSEEMIRWIDRQRREAEAESSEETLK